MFVIAGVTGHVGSTIANELLAEGKPVKVLVRDAEKGAAWSKKGAEVAVARLDDADSLVTALKGASGFFTLLPPNYQSASFFQTQRDTADAIAAAVKQSGVGHVVMLSSIGADLETGTGPIRGLHYLEKVLRDTGVALTVIRAGMFQENFENSITPAKQAGIYPNFGDASNYPIPMIATKDIGALAATELVKGPGAPGSVEVIDLQGPAYSIDQVAAALGKALGKTVNVVHVPQSAWVATLVQAGMSEHISEIFAEMYAGFASGKIAPRGDRMVQGSTPLEETIQRSLG